LVAPRGRHFGTIREPCAGLNAMYFGGKGLGGRGTSFSEFAFVEVDLPHPEIAFDYSELNVEGSTPGTYFDRYNFTTLNWEQYSDEIFAATDAHGPCGLNQIPSRTWVDIYDAADGSRLYGFCALDSADDLASLWFSTPAGQGPPDFYIELWDRAEGVKYRSNTVVNVPTEYLLSVGILGGYGSVTSLPAGISCQEPVQDELVFCSATFAAGTVVTLTAAPEVDYINGGWTGGHVVCGGANCDVTMDEHTDMSVTFLYGPPS